MRYIGIVHTIDRKVSPVRIQKNIIASSNLTRVPKIFIIAFCPQWSQFILNLSGTSSLCFDARIMFLVSRPFRSMYKRYCAKFFCYKMRQSRGVDSIINCCWFTRHSKVYIIRFFVYTQKWISDTSSYQKKTVLVFDSFLQEANVCIKDFEVFKKKHSIV